jgi:2-methylaconitate cis-trans-isomerase PrpF
MIADYQRQVGGFDSASLQVNTRMMSGDKAHASMELFGREVLPKFSKS